MPLASLDELRKRIIIALFSDDELMEELVLKGGNAIDLIHQVSQRGSVDLDFSLPADFPDPDIDRLQARFGQLLRRSLNEVGYAAFDIKLEPTPRHVTDDLKDFWGGYRLTFKVIPLDTYRELSGDARKLRMAAENAGPGHRKNFRVEFSKHEYCSPKQPAEIDGYRIYVYTPAMIVCEKLRAICQQTDEYRKLVKSQAKSARARDFFDIHTLIAACHIELALPENVDLLERMFHAKRVPLSLLGQIDAQREFHRPDFEAVRATVKPGVTLREFDFYVDFVIGEVQKLKSLWDE